MRRCKGIVSRDEKEKVPKEEGYLKHSDWIAVFTVNYFTCPPFPFIVPRRLLEGSKLLPYFTALLSYSVAKPLSEGGCKSAGSAGGEVVVVNLKPSIFEN